MQWYSNTEKLCLLNLVFRSADAFLFVSTHLTASCLTKPPLDGFSHYRGRVVMLYKLAGAQNKRQYNFIPMVLGPIYISEQTFASLLLVSGFNILFFSLIAQTFLVFLTIKSVSFLLQLYVIFSRPGRSQGLFYKHLRDSFINSFS